MVGNIALHLKNIFASGELNKDSVSEVSSATQFFQLESGN